MYLSAKRDCDSGFIDNSNSAIQKVEISMDMSGIYSLAGFAFQIKVFTLKLLEAQYDEKISFEAIDDVSISPISIDNGYVKNEDSLSIYAPGTTGPQCIQVKCTDLYKDNLKKILINWLVMIHEYPDAKMFAIVSDKESRIKASMKSIEIDALYREICTTKKKASSTIAKAKKIYEGDELLYKEKVAYILSRYIQESIENIEVQIYEGCKSLFHYGAIDEDIYALRVKELVEHLSGSILISVNEHIPFHADRIALAKKVEDICNRVTEREYIPDFVTYKRTRRIELSDTKIVTSREYKQLCACSLEENRLAIHLLYKEYYADLRYRYLEFYKENEIEQIEDTTYDNFCTAKESLVLKHEDNPLARLIETKKMDNAKTHDEQSKWGACIYLTRAEQPIETQISWSDEYE